MNKLSRALLVATAVLSSAPLVEAKPLADPQWGQSAWRFETSYNHWSGDYGTGEDTDTTYIPFRISRVFPRSRLSLTVPYISNTGHQTVAFIPGGPTQRGGPKTMATDVTMSGLGDVILKGDMELLMEGDVLPETSGAAFIKFPTADDKKQLGTGEFDEGVSLDFYKTITPVYFGDFNLGYVFVGDPPGIDYNNKWTFSAGGGRVLTRHVNISAYYEEERNIVPGRVDPRDLLLVLDGTPTETVAVFGALLLGLSDGAPDKGIMFGGRVSF